jgi:DNA mismatch endonuclease (patch repair protein)
VRPDVVFTRQRVAIFVDGCFWHSCPDHGNIPHRNREYWEPKLERNRARDRQVDLALAKSGWRVLRIWEHEPTQDAARKVARALVNQAASG